MRRVEPAVAALCGWLAVATACAALSGCAKVSTLSGGGSAGSGTVAGVLRVGFYEDLDNLNPSLSLQTFIIPVQILVFDGLVGYDDRYRLQGDAAAQVPSLQNGGISKDGRTITYRLRRGLAFSDGVRLTAADVKYTWQQIMNP